MQNEILEQFTAFSKNSFKPMVTFGKIINEAFERTAKQHMEHVKDSFSTSALYMQNLVNSKKVEDVIAVQTQALKEASNKAIACAQKNLETLVSTSTEVSKLFEENFSHIVANCADKADKKAGSSTGTK